MPDDLERIADLLAIDPGAVGVRQVPGPADAGAAVAYLYRGSALVAAAGADEPAAVAALRAKVELHAAALGSLPEIPVVQDLLVAQRKPGLDLLRVPARPMSPERALLELDLGVEGALIFLDESTGRFSVVSRDVAGTPTVQHVGDPVPGDVPEARTLPDPVRRPADAVEQARRHDKAARVRPLLRCPACRGELQDEPGALCCPPCGRSFESRGGVPVLAAEVGYDAAPPPGEPSQNPYAPQALELIEAHRDGWVLDMGSGSPAAPFYNVVHLDVFAYDTIDVATDGGPLPFADATFDAVLSEAVLEHVPDPGAYVAEMARVLRPGGRVRLDAAFLQPYHGYPDHYFNMTRTGLQRVVEGAGLRLLGLSAGEHQKPFVALSLLLSGYLAGTHDEEKRAALAGIPIGEVLRLLENGEVPPFDGLTEQAIDRLAAGFCCLAEKPD